MCNDLRRAFSTLTTTIRNTTRCCLDTLRKQFSNISCLITISLAKEKLDQVDQRQNKGGCFSQSLVTVGYMLNSPLQIFLQCFTITNVMTHQRVSLAALTTGVFSSPLKHLKTSTLSHSVKERPRTPCIKHFQFQVHPTTKA